MQEQCGSFSDTEYLRSDQNNRADQRPPRVITMLWLRCVMGGCCMLCKGHHRHHSIWILAFRSPPLLPKTTYCSCTHQNLANELVPRCFSCWLHRAQALRGFASCSLYLLVTTGSSSSLWVPGSCCCLLLLLHGSYHSESFLISKGTHSHISTPSKIGTHSYIFSLTKIIKLWEKKTTIHLAVSEILSVSNGGKSRTISSAIAELQAKTTSELQCRWFSKS